MQDSKRLKVLTGLVALTFVPFIMTACQQTTGPGTSAEPAAPVPATNSSSKGALIGQRLADYKPGESYTPLSSCNLSNVNAVDFGEKPVALKRGVFNHFSGWIIASGVARPEFWLRFDDEQANRYLHVPFRLTIERPDVVAVHPAAPKVTGFDVIIPAATLPKGQFHVYIAVKSGDTTYICDSGRHIEVNP